MSDPLRKYLKPDHGGKQLGFDSVLPKMDEGADIEELMYQGSRVRSVRLRLDARGYPQIR